MGDAAGLAPVIPRRPESEVNAYVPVRFWLAAVPPEYCSMVPETVPDIPGEPGVERLARPIEADGVPEEFPVKRKM